MINMTPILGPVLNSLYAGLRAVYVCYVLCWEVEPGSHQLQVSFMLKADTFH